MTAVNLKSLLVKANKNKDAIAGLVVLGWEDALAFTEAADFQLIQSISQQTSGKYFRVLAAEDLQNVFIEIDEIINQSILSLYI